MSIEITGILGLILFGCVIYALQHVAQSKESSTVTLIWILVLLLLPFLGFIIWLFIGPRGK